MLAPAVTPDIRRALVVGAERSLVTTLVARALKRTPPAIVGASPTAGAPLVGAFAAVVAAVVRKSHGGAPLRVLAAGPAPEVEGELARACPDAVAVMSTVLVGDEAFAARVVASPAAALMAAPAPWDRRALAALGAVSLSLPIVARAVPLATADVAALREGDVLLLGNWPLRGGGDGHLAGPVVLVAPGSNDNAGRRWSGGGRGGGARCRARRDRRGHSDGAPVGRDEQRRRRDAGASRG
jgi:hypothetical protein